MALRFAYTRPDGGVSVVNAARREDLERTIKFDSNEAYENYVLQRSIPADAANVTRLTDAATPDRCEFRNGWVLTDGKITFHMEKCREILRNKMRIVRQPLLEALDVDYQRADEAGDAVKKAAIAKSKQTLRDVTKDPAIDSARSPDDLRSVWPECLPRAS